MSYSSLLAQLTSSLLKHKLVCILFHIPLGKLDDHSSDKSISIAFAKLCNQSMLD